MFRSGGSGKWMEKDESVLENSIPENQSRNAAEISRPRMQIAEGLSPLELIRRAKAGVEHVVQHDSLEFPAEHRAAMLMMNKPKSFFKDPVATVFREPADDLVVYRDKFDAHEKKHRLLRTLNDFVLSLRQSRGILLPAMSIADELYTNGSKNAWDRDQTPYEDEPRRHGEVEFFAVASETRLLLGCRDSFGSLKIPALIGRIAACLENGVAASILKDSWGAGIGAFYIFDSAKSLYVGVNPGVETVVCATLALGKRQKDADEISKNLHFVELGRE